MYVGEGPVLTALVVIVIVIIILIFKVHVIIIVIILYYIDLGVGMGDYENMRLSVQVSQLLRLLATLHMYVDFIQQSN